MSEETTYPFQWHCEKDDANFAIFQLKKNILSEEGGPDVVLELVHEFDDILNGQFYTDLGMNPGEFYLFSERGQEPCEECSLKAKKYFDTLSKAREELRSMFFEMHKGENKDEN